MSPISPLLCLHRDAKPGPAGEMAAPAGRAGLISPASAFQTAPPPGPALAGAAGPSAGAITCQEQLWPQGPRTPAPPPIHVPLGVPGRDPPMSQSRCPASVIIEQQPPGTPHPTGRVSSGKSSSIQTDSSAPKLAGCPGQAPVLPTPLTLPFEWKCLPQRKFPAQIGILRAHGQPWGGSQHSCLGLLVGPKPGAWRLRIL